MPAVVAIRTQIQQLVPPPTNARPTEVVAVPPVPVDASVGLATRLIIRWEVTSEATYRRKYAGVVCPPSPSGPTFGVGYDGGTQTPLDIARDWRAHPRVDALKTTSGQTGNLCRPALVRLTGVRTDWLLAYGVFSTSTLPGYKAASRRALGPCYEALPPGARAGLDSLGYNRGWGRSGERRREIAAIIEICRSELPTQEKLTRIAGQLVQMCRLWPTLPGLCARRRDEAFVVLNGRMP